MNILLVNPWIYDFAAYDLWMRPLGLLYIASFLEQFGHRVSLINCLDRHDSLLKERYGDRLPANRAYDCGKFFSQEVEKPAPLRGIPRKYRRYGIPADIFDEYLSKIPVPELIGITSGMTYWYPGVFEVIRRLKKKFPGVPVVLGGIYASLCYEHALHGSGADYVVRGRGEIPLLKIVDKMEGESRNYANIEEMDEIIPAYHLLPKVKSVAILTSRGCPFSCSYCASHLLEPHFKQRSTESVVNEIDEYVRKFNLKDVAFYDDALLVNASEHIIPLLRKITEKFPDLRFHTPNGLHVRYLTGEVANLFWRANFKTIRLSFESSNPVRQKDSSGKVTTDEFLEAIDNMVSAGFKKENLETYIMIGLPSQSIDEVMESIQFAHGAGVKVKIVQFSPIPGTLEFKRALQDCPSLLREPLLHNNSIFPQWARTISYEQLWKIKNLTQKLNQKLKT